jgi:tetratricopeptide (TPR) repeat protein
MYRIAFLLLVFCFVTLSSQNQKNIDSLKRIIPQTKKTKLAGVYFSLIDELLSTNPSLGLKYADTALKVSLSIKDTANIATAYTYFGMCNYHKSDLISAIEFFTKSFVISKQTKNYRTLLPNLNYLAVIYSDYADQKKAFEFVEESKKISFILNDSSSISSSLKISGGVNRHFGKYDEALKYYYQALKYERKNSGKYNYTLNEMGYAFNGINQSDSALYYFNATLNLFRSSFDMNGQVESFKGLGLVYARDKNCAAAIENYEKALEISLSVNKYSEDNQVLFSLLQKVFADKGDFKSAYKYSQLYLKGKDTLNIAQKMTRFEASLEIEKQKFRFEQEKEQEKILAAEQQKRKNIILIAIASILLITALFSLLIFGKFKESQRQKKTIENQKQKEYKTR